MAVVRGALSAWVLAFVVQGCAEAAGDPGEVTIDSPDPLARTDSALALDDLTFTPLLPLCATVSDTYDYAPWAKDYAGDARCVKQTTVVPELGFGTQHETSASFPEFTGLNLVAINQDSPAQKCRKAGIRVKIRWTSDGVAPSTWDYEVHAVPKFASIAASPDTLTIPRVVACVATHTSGLGGHGPGQFTITTTPFTGQPVLTTLAPLRPMTSHVEAVF